MKVTIFSYRFAEEILNSKKYLTAWKELINVFTGAPLFIFPDKSKTNSRLDVVQQVMNTYFDRKFGVDCGWEYHPAATKIPNSNLTTDFRKNFGSISVQMEIQFGNMSRWYSDIFKFQAAYSQSLAKLAISVVPTLEVSTRIDSNIVNYERAVRELPSADLSITLPILLVGLGMEADTQTVDLSRTRFGIKQITGRGMSENRWRIVNAYLSGAKMASIGPDSDIGPMIESTDEVETADPDEGSGG